MVYTAKQSRDDYLIEMKKKSEQFVKDKKRQAIEDKKTIIAMKKGMIESKKRVEESHKRQLESKKSVEESNKSLAALREKYKDLLDESDSESDEEKPVKIDEEKPVKNVKEKPVKIVKEKPVKKRKLIYNEELEKSDSDKILKAEKKLQKAHEKLLKKQGVLKDIGTIMKGKSELYANKNMHMVVRTNLNVKKDLDSKVKKALETSVVEDIKQKIKGRSIKL